MSVLLATGLRRFLGSQEILAGADLRLESGEKVGCVGPNGEGKTTLLRILTGEEGLDGGSVQLAKGTRIGYVVQRPEFAPGATVLAYVEGGLDEVHAVQAELGRLEHALDGAHGVEQERLVHRYGELTHRMEQLGGWESERRVETVLSGIGLARALWEREARTLSGGEKSRALLARELVGVPDLLLLDEPTNHLDLAGIEWLEEYLREIPSAVLMVSHDRRLLDNLASAIVELERGLLLRTPGNYSKYVELKAERFKAALRAWEEQQEFMRKEDAFIRAHLGSQRTGEAKGRQKRLESLPRLARPFLDVRRPVIRLAAVERGGETVLEAEDLAVGHGSHAVLSGVSLRIARGDCVGIVGPNGSGKSTLLRTLAGRLRPLAGDVRLGHRSVPAFYDQDSSDLDPEGTPYREMRGVEPLWTDEEIRSHLALFLFRGSDVDLPVRGLSGGERARLSLAKLVLGSPSWLALDEPTNHLDLAGRTALEEFLGSFPGVLVFVSHDRAFLDLLANRILWVEGGGVRALRGNYAEVHATLASEVAGRTEETARARHVAEERRKREEEKARSQGAPRASRNPWKLEKLESEIIALEEEKESLESALTSAEVWRDPGALRRTQVRLSELERALEEKNLEWERWI
jgi:ATP-binding cassette subfamily F protein 3